MERRNFLRGAVSAVAAMSPAFALGSPGAPKMDGVKGIPTANAKLTSPANGTINVAMVVSERVNVIDLCGPWGVFESVQAPAASFNLMIVAETMDIVRSGSGLKIKPDHIFADAPRS